jgi:hypothetical protein
MTPRHISSSSGSSSHGCDGRSGRQGFGRAGKPLLPDLPAPQRSGGDRSQGRTLPLLVVRRLFVSLVLGRCRRCLPGLRVRLYRASRPRGDTQGSRRLGPAADGCPTIDRRGSTCHGRRGAGRDPRQRDPGDRWRRGGRLRAIRSCGPTGGTIAVRQPEGDRRGLRWSDDGAVRSSAAVPDRRRRERPRHDVDTRTEPSSNSDPDSHPVAEGHADPYPDPETDPEADSDSEPHTETDARLRHGAITQGQDRQGCPNSLDGSRVHRFIHARAWAGHQSRPNPGPDPGCLPSGVNKHRRDGRLSRGPSRHAPARDQSARLISRSNAGRTTPRSRITEDWSTADSHR